MLGMDEATLRGLAEDRPMSGPEIHPVNTFYGHAAIIKEYLGIDPGYPLKAMLEHAPSVQEYVWEVEEWSKLPLLLCASERYARYFNATNRGGKTAVAIGPYPFYVTAADTGRKDPARTLLLFPKHSTHHILVEYDVEKYLRRIERLAGSFDRVVACLYWKDVLLGRDREYRRAGIELVTAGHMFDDGFLPRLMGIIAQADLVVSGHPGTDVSYSVLMGKPVVVVPSGEGATYADKELEARHKASLMQANEMQQTYARVFAEPLDAPTPQQVELVRNFCGVNNVMSPRELMDVIVQAEAMYCERHGLPFVPPAVHGAEAARG